MLYKINENIKFNTETNRYTGRGAKHINAEIDRKKLETLQQVIADNDQKNPHTRALLTPPDYTVIRSVYDGMQSRCHGYTERYAGCTVCDEWLDQTPVEQDGKTYTRGFLRFADWYRDQWYYMPFDRLECDKDIRIMGNRIYSPTRCYLLPRRINWLISRPLPTPQQLPDGTWFAIITVPYDIQHHAVTAFDGHKSQRIVADTYDSCVEMVVYRRMELIQYVADCYREYLPPVIYDAICSHTGRHTIYDDQGNGYRNSNRPAYRRNVEWLRDQGII